MYAALIDPVIAAGYHMSGDGSGWWMGGMMVWMVVFWTAVILGMGWLIRAGSGRRRERGVEPAQILGRRFAEGAITLDEYQAQKAALIGEPIDPRDGASGHQRAGEGR
jgi:uncharacterized membrane protein